MARGVRTAVLVAVALVSTAAVAAGLESAFTKKIDFKALEEVRCETLAI